MITEDDKQFLESFEQYFEVTPLKITHCSPRYALDID